MQILKLSFDRKLIKAEMDAERQSLPGQFGNEGLQQGNNNTSYLFEKLKEAFEYMTEKIADTFTYSKFIEYHGGEILNDYDKNLVENIIHQLRNNIRSDFKEVFFQVCQRHRIQENLHHLTFELEKAKILKEFDQIVGHLFSQGPNYYFQFLSGVVAKLRAANEEVVDRNGS